MDDATMRWLARRLLDELADAVTDPGERHEVRDLLVRALAQPAGPAATRATRRVLRRESVRPWLQRQRIARPDDLKLGDDDRPARYLTAEVPGEVVVDVPFPLEVAITRESHERSAPLRPFAVPPGGVTVQLVLRPGGLRVRSGLVHGTLVPPDEKNRDSDAVLFELSAPAPGRYRPSVRAYVGGQPVGELTVDVMAGTEAVTGVSAVVSAEVNDLAGYPGGLAVDIARDGDRYRYRVLSEDGVIQEEHHADLPAGLLTLLHNELTLMATSRDYEGPAARLTLQRLGLRLWNDAFPQRVGAHLLEQLNTVRSVSVISDLHTVPWEVLYPAGQTGDGRFLAERLPVLRQVPGAGRWRRTLRLDPAAYVHPPRSTLVGDELDAVRDVLGADVTHLPPVSGLVGLDDLLRRGAFGVLHIACHSESQRHGWDRVELADGPFTPVFLEQARTARTLDSTGPLVFFNACRTTGGAMDTRVESWAAAFLDAGAAAFVGSVWPVRTGTAPAFATAFYDQLTHERQPLGAASLAARMTVKDDGDPTWLAYAVYGAPDIVTTAS